MQWSLITVPQPKRQVFSNDSMEHLPFQSDTKIDQGPLPWFAGVEKEFAKRILVVHMLPECESRSSSRSSHSI
jgi:hypothetical protein